MKGLLLRGKRSYGNHRHSRSARAKAAEARLRAEDAKRYSSALETVIQAARYMQYLQGVDENVGNAAKQLESIAKKTSDAITIANESIAESVKHLREVASAADEISAQLRHVGSVALRAQRDMVRSHDQLMTEIQASNRRQEVDSGPQSLSQGPSGKGNSSEIGTEPGAAADRPRD